MQASNKDEGVAKAGVARPTLDVTGKRTAASGIAFLSSAAPGAHLGKLGHVVAAADTIAHGIGFIGARPAAQVGSAIMLTSNEETVELMLCIVCTCGASPQAAMLPA